MDTAGATAPWWTGPDGEKYKLKWEGDPYGAGPNTPPGYPGEKPYYIVLRHTPFVPGVGAPNKHFRPERGTLWTKEEAAREVLRISRSKPAEEAGAEGKPQTLLPGVAPVTDKDKADVKAKKPLKGTKPQKEPGGMFSDEADQTDIGDFLKPATGTVKSAATNVAEGADAAIKGLMELFGGKGAKLSSGFTFDEETYAKAKPLFKQAITKFAAAGRDVAEMVQRLVHHMVQLGMSREAIQAMRPYVVRFVADERATAPLVSEPNRASNLDEKIDMAPGDLSLVEELRDRLLDPEWRFPHHRRGAQVPRRPRLEGQERGGRQQGSRGVHRARRGAGGARHRRGEQKPEAGERLVPRRAGAECSTRDA
jgi:hypothetical protein